MPRPATRTATITKRAIEPPSSGTPASANAPATATTTATTAPSAKRVHCERTNVNRTRRILAARVAFGSSHDISAAWAVGVCGPAVNNFGSVGPIWSGSAASRLNPPVSRPHSAVATMHAAIAPADDPPMFTNLWVRASSHAANGYTTPLVIPPFMTRSHSSGTSALSGYDASRSSRARSRACSTSCGDRVVAVSATPDTPFYGLARRDASLPVDATAEQAELIALRVGEHDPRNVTLADVDPARAQREQALELFGLVDTRRTDVEVKAILDGLRLWNGSEDQQGRAGVVPCRRRPAQSFSSSMTGQPSTSPQKWATTFGSFASMLISVKTLAMATASQLPLFGTTARWCRTQDRSGAPVTSSSCRRPWR